MGLQNSLVTRISNAVVRTTHLTGLFTDLGIELSQLFFYRDAQSRRRLFSSIRLRFTIIGFFFLGGIAGGLLYSKVGIAALLSAALLLAIGILYDNLRLKIRLARRRCRQRQKRK
ncbi:YoaK family protein [Flavobacterium sp. KACC 22763]|uniref:YoaK family protein n=1 Tax=Flavobacterium sp. KACC 22763 TaxID=3025668 RepID=UPI00308268A4